MKITSIGSVHGRFQLFHNDHLRYITTALNQCDIIIIGITSYVNSELTYIDKASHRSIPKNNPFTYYERTQIISSALDECGIQSNRYFFTPFPIETPDILYQFIPVNIACFTTVYDDWNREKVKILEEYGYQVNVLWESDNKLITGSNLREKIIIGDESWMEDVPKATIEAVNVLNIRHRLKRQVLS